MVSRTAQPTTALRLDWRSFWSGFSSDWSQGEHVSLFGPTGSGKTSLAERLTLYRARNAGYVVIVATKPRDSGLTSFAERHEFKTIKEWPPMRRDRKVLLWTASNRLRDGGSQQKKIEAALDDIYVSGGWTIYFDELYYVYDQMNLKPDIRKFYTQSRSLDITVIASTQRPSRVAPEMYSQADHLFFFQFNDQRDIDRISEINRVNKKEVQSIIGGLKRFEFLYIDARSGDLVISKMEGVP